MASASRKPNRYAQGQHPPGVNYQRESISHGQELIVAVENIAVNTAPGSERLFFAVNYAGVERIGDPWQLSDAGWSVKTFALPYSPGTLIFFWVSEEGSGIQRYLGETQPVQPEQLMNAGPFHEKWCGDLDLFQQFGAHRQLTGKLSTSLQIVAQMTSIAKQWLPKHTGRQVSPFPVGRGLPAPVVQPVVTDACKFWRCLDQIEVPSSDQGQVSQRSASPIRCAQVRSCSPANRLAPAQRTVYIRTTPASGSRQSSPASSNAGSREPSLCSSRSPPRRVIKFTSPALLNQVQQSGSLNQMSLVAPRSSNLNPAPVRRSTSSSRMRIGLGGARVGTVVATPVRALSFEPQGRQCTPSPRSIPLPLSPTLVTPVFRQTSVSSAARIASRSASPPRQQFVLPEGLHHGGSSANSSRSTSPASGRQHILLERRVPKDAKVLGHCKVLPSLHVSSPSHVYRGISSPTSSPSHIYRGISSPTLSPATRASSMRSDVEDIMLSKRDLSSCQVYKEPQNAISIETKQNCRALSIASSTEVGSASASAEGPRVWLQEENMDSASSLPKAQSSPASIFSRPSASEEPHAQVENGWPADIAIELEAETEFIAVNQESKNRYVDVGPRHEFGSDPASLASRQQAPDNLEELVAAKKRELQRSLGALRDLDKRLSDSDTHEHSAEIKQDFLL